MMELEGVIERITFTNETNDYRVARLKRASGELVTVTGEMPQLYVGEEVRLMGDWVTHKEYGRQFQVVERELLIPQTEKGIERFLAGGFIKGVGPATAKKLVSKFGLDTLEVISNDPESVGKLPGIGFTKAQKISANLQGFHEIQRIIVFLQGLGISPTYAMKIYRQYGQKAAEIVRENPYQLADQIIGIGFKTADQIAQSLGIEPDSSYRIQAGLHYLMGEICSEGHIFVEERRLMETAVSELAVNELQIAAELEALIVQQELVRGEHQGESIIYLPHFYHSEVGVAARVQYLATYKLKPLLLDAPTLLDGFTKDSGIVLADKQREAALKAMEAGMLVITGGPGTGKTTIIKAILHLFNQAGSEVLLAAPTGRAAKRLAEATGKPAKTIHRLLGSGNDAGGRFQHNEEDPLDTGAIIVDEFSMVDIMLFYSLLKAIAPGTRLIVVGDVDQLPSVGPGSVLRDLIGSGCIPAVRLEVIFRQAQESLIVANAHRINRGEFPWLTQSKDFFFVAEEDPERVAKLLPDLVKRRIPGYIGCDPIEDIQVLAPMRRTVTGVDNLNQSLRKALNQADPRKPELKMGNSFFRLGDKVMQVRNNYNKQVFNGDMGRICDMDLEERRLIVSFQEAEGERTVEYDQDELDQLTLSYAITVHKSQGNEYPVVIMPVLTQHYLMLQRNLLYTAVTRAKKMAVLVGTKRAIGISVRNNRIEQRNSLLKERIKAVFNG